jgi:hypothetical protein
MRLVVRIDDTELRRNADREIGNLKALETGLTHRSLGIGKLEGALDDVGTIEVLLEPIGRYELASLIPALLRCQPIN